MMEMKLLISLCVVLVLSSTVSSTLDGTQDPLPPNPGNFSDAAEANVTSLNPDFIPHVENLSNKSSTENQTTASPLESEMKDRGTQIFPTTTSGSDRNENATILLPSRNPPTVSTENLSPTSHTSSPPPVTNVTHFIHRTPVSSTTPSSKSPNTSDLLVSFTSGSAAPSKQQTMPETSSPTKSEPQNPSISSTTTTTTTTTQSTSTSSTPNVLLMTGTSKKTSQGKVSTPSQRNLSSTPLSKTSTQDKPHGGSTSQLNAGGDTKMAHDAPTLDPLLAGLVSAFIITAVIITLLLFLKLRRRDNRPEFRRLQDLPMDDMMEDTPLSMYSY